MIYNNYYAVYVSKNGLIFKLKNNKLSSCNMTIDRDGYFRISVSRLSQYAKEHKGHHCVHVHKIVAHTFLGEQGNLVVDHIDRNRQNNNLSNLRYVSVRENAQNAKDMSGKNNPMYGKNAWAIACNKRTDEEIELIKASKSKKMKQFWAENPEAKALMAQHVSEAKQNHGHKN